MITESGENWTMHNADCQDAMRDMNDLSVDHVITDPPYEAAAHTKGRRIYAAGGGLVSAPIPFPAITEDERSSAGRQFSRLAKRWIAVFCQVEGSQLWADAIGDYIRTGVWIKPDGQPQLTGDRPGVGYESIVFCHRPGRKRWNGGGRNAIFTHNKNDIESRLDGRAPHPHHEAPAAHVRIGCIVHGTWRDCV